MTLGAAGDALLTDAHERAARTLARAEAEAREHVDAARLQADELVAKARAQGEADGRLEAGREEARERAVARMEVLAAQREAYEELRRRAGTAVLALRDEPGYADLLARLEAAARSELGESIRLELDPPGAGGVLATAGSRRVDLTLVALAQRCVDGLGPRLARLWK